MRRVVALAAVGLLLAGCPDTDKRVNAYCKDGTFVSGKKTDVERVCRQHGGMPQ